MKNYYCYLVGVYLPKDHKICFWGNKIFITKPFLNFQNEMLFENEKIFDYTKKLEFQGL